MKQDNEKERQLKRDNEAAERQRKRDADNVQGQAMLQRLERESERPKEEHVTPTPQRQKTLKVRAIQPGYIGDGPLGMIYRNPGDVFTLVPREIPFLNLVGKPELDADGRLKTKWLTAEQQFSANWMEVVHDDEPERLTTAQQDINRQIAELNAGGRPRPDEESSRNQF